MGLLTDTKPLFDIISKSNRTSEKRILLDIRAAREGYENRDVSNIRLARSSANLADGLTEEEMQIEFFHLLKSAKHIVDCEQWILR